MEDQEGRYVNILVITTELASMKLKPTSELAILAIRIAEMNAQAKMALSLQQFMMNMVSQIDDRE